MKRNSTTQNNRDLYRLGMSRKRRIERVEDDLVNMQDQTMEKMREEVRNKFDSLAASPGPSC